LRGLALAEHVAETRGPKGVASFAQRLMQFANDMTALEQVLADAPKDAFAASVWRLSLVRWDTWRPLALLWFADYQRGWSASGAGATRKVDAARRRFDALHRRCVGMTLAGFSAADRERIFGRAIAQASRGQNPLASTGALAFSAPQLSRIRETLRTPVTDKDVRLTLVRWSESMLHDGPVPTYIRDATVEHILPRRPDATSRWVYDFPDADDRYMACNALGNLAALDKARNEGLRNADFDAKRAVLLAAAADFRTLADVPETGPWTAARIEDRTSRLASQVEMLLDLPAPFEGTKRATV
jgi:Protein of unknown function (DUF1524)